MKTSMDTQYNKADKTIRSIQRTTSGGEETAFSLLGRTPPPPKPWALFVQWFDPLRALRPSEEACFSLTAFLKPVFTSGCSACKKRRSSDVLFFLYIVSPFYICLFLYMSCTMSSSLQPLDAKLRLSLIVLMITARIVLILQTTVFL